MNPTGFEPKPKRDIFIPLDIVLAVTAIEDLNYNVSYHTNLIINAEVTKKVGGFVVEEIVLRTNIIEESQRDSILHAAYLCVTLFGITPIDIVDSIDVEKNVKNLSLKETITNESNRAGE